MLIIKRQSVYYPNFSTKYIPHKNNCYSRYYRIPEFHFFTISIITTCLSLHAIYIARHLKNRSGDFYFRIVVEINVIKALNANIYLKVNIILLVCMEVRSLVCLRCKLNGEAEMLRINAHGRLDVNISH